jgi:cytochrome d ubiquinol oxidase subunit II
VPLGNAAGEPTGSWLNPTSLLVGTLAVATAAYTAAVYLAGDARREGLDDLAETFRRRALLAGAVAGAIAICGPLVLHEDARPLYDGLSSGWGLVAGLVSGIAGVTTLALLYRGRFEPARWSAAVAVSAIIAGWGLAQEPSFLPGLTLEEAAAGDATLVAIAVSVGFGLLILLPSLALLFRLVLTGRFDPGREAPDGPAATADSTAPAIPLAAPAATAGIGALVSLVFEGWPLAAGVALMLIGAVLAFLLFAAPEEEA